MDQHTTISPQSARVLRFMIAAAIVAACLLGISLTRANAAAPSTTQVAHSHGVPSADYPASSPYTRFAGATTFSTDRVTGALLVTAHLAHALPASAVAAHQGVQHLSLVIGDRSGLVASVSDGDCSVMRVRNAAPDLHMCAGTLHTPSMVIQHGRTVQWRVPLSVLIDSGFAPRVQVQVTADYAAWDGSGRSVASVVAPGPIAIGATQ